MQGIIEPSVVDVSMRVTSHFDVGALSLSKSASRDDFRRYEGISGT